MGAVLAIVGGILALTWHAPGRQAPEDAKPVEMTHIGAGFDEGQGADKLPLGLGNQEPITQLSQPFGDEPPSLLRLVLVSAALVAELAFVIRSQIGR